MVCKLQFASSGHKTSTHSFGMCSPSPIYSGYPIATQLIQYVWVCTCMMWLQIQCITNDLTAVAYLASCICWAVSRAIQPCQRMPPNQPSIDHASCFGDIRGLNFQATYHFKLGVCPGVHCWMPPIRPEFGCEMNTHTHITGPQTSISVSAFTWQCQLTTVYL